MPRKNDPARNKFTSLRWTEDELLRIKAAANREYLSMIDFVRRCVLQKIDENERSGKN